MDLNEIDELEKIFEDSYNDPGDGVLISEFWFNIEKHNLNFGTNKKNEAFISLLRFLLHNGLIRINKAFEFDKEDAKWEKGIDSYLNELKEFLGGIPNKELEEDPGSELTKFPYCFADWQVQWPIDLRKYGLSSD